MIAVYRALYGEDFFLESARSILPHVDRIVLVLAPRPWGTSKGVTWKGEWIEWPEKFDGLSDLAFQLFDQGHNVDVIVDFFPTPFGQYQHIVDRVLGPLAYLPSDVIFIEPDHVFTEVQAASAFAEWRACEYSQATTTQVELWAPPGHKPEWRVPFRPGRASVEFYRNVRAGTPLGRGLHPLLSTVHNFGFCFSEKTMRWKHLTALAFAQEISDCPPDPKWLEDKWLTWHPTENNHNLEIALGLGDKIPKAVPYDPALLPESIKRRYGL